MDNHNQVRQFELALEKSWVPKGEGACWRRLFTTLMGMHVVDVHKACDAFLPHGHRLRGLTTKQFVNELAEVLVKNSENDECANMGARRQHGSGSGSSQGSRGAGRVKRTLTGSERDENGNRILTCERFPRNNNIGRTDQRNCMVCARVRGNPQKTTWMCPQLGNAAVCSPAHTERKCFEYLQERGVLPPRKYTVDMAILNRLEGGLRVA